MAFNYDWIVPGRLAQGSFPGHPPKAPWKDFDVIVYCAEELQPRGKPPAGKIGYRAPLDDDPYRPVPPDVAKIVSQLADHLAGHLRKNHRVLVTCAMGANRSGLVTGLTLMRLTGMSGRQAVDTIKQRRRSGDHEPLSNTMFEMHLCCVR